MTYAEFFTIYLAIGAPFGVYFFLLNRSSGSNSNLYLKTILATLFWIFFAFSLVFSRFTKNSVLISTTDFKRELSAEHAAQRLLSAFAKNSLTKVTVTFFEFRELLERYIGLTLAIQNSEIDSPPTQQETEIFRITGREKKDLQLGGRCLHRRNFLRLKTHQIRVKDDFLRICEEFGYGDFYKAALSLVETLDDHEAINALQRLNPETGKKIGELNSSVKLEKDLWQPAQPEQAFIPQPRNSISSLTQTSD
jgi:hypothetical protein